MTTMRAMAGRTNSRVLQPSTKELVSSGQSLVRKWRLDARRPGPQLAPWQLRLASELMRAQISGSIAIPDIAQECGISLSYFVRGFRNMVGVSPYEWFLGQRVLRAKQLLMASDAPIAEIALECGFADQSHFTNAFVRRVGKTPRKWRREAWSICAFTEHQTLPRDQGCASG